MEKKPEERIIVIPAGVFSHKEPVPPTAATDVFSIQVFPFEIHFGFVEANNIGGAWRGTTTQEIKYNSSGKNLDVVVDVPKDISQESYHLAYVLRFSTIPRERNEVFTTENRYIERGKGKDTEGKYVKFPITNYAARFPWKEQTYKIHINNLTSSKVAFTEKIAMEGKANVVYYGFTTASQAHYMSNPELKWVDSFLQFKLEGTISVYHLHIGNGDEGSYVMNDVWIRVPKGMNVLWKVGYDRFEGNDFENGIYAGHYETDTFFMTP